MSNLAVVNQYLKLFYLGDFEGAERFVADEFHFKGPFVEVNGRYEFVAAASRLRPVVRGHVLLKQWEEGADVCSIYDVNLQTPAGSGNVTMAEWNRVLNGKLISGRLIFDTGEFRKIVPAPPSIEVQQ